MPDQDPARKAEQPVSPTVREVAIVLFRQRKVFVGVSGLVLVLAVVYAFPRATYRAHLPVLVRRGRVDHHVTAQTNTPSDFSRVEITEEELNSEVELLKDTDVLGGEKSEGAFGCAVTGGSTRPLRTSTRTWARYVAPANA